MSTRHFVMIMALAGLSVAMTAHSAGGDAEAGRRKTVTCNACHGQASMQSVPNLGGQTPAYFVASMRAYQDGKRSHATMRDVAKAYTDRELKNFAAWYAQLASAAQGEPAQDAKPEAAAACEACHGPQGRVPVNPDSPVLAGQKAAYLKMTLREYRDGSRRHALMQPAAAALGDAQVDELAEYFARTPGLVVK